MDQIKYIFNNDERGIQYFIINTNNLSDFKLSYIDTPYKTIFDDLRSTLEHDQEYLDFENTFLFKLYILKNRKNIKLSKYDNSIIERMNRSSKDKFLDNIIDFLENTLSKKIYKIKYLIDLLPSYNVSFDLEKVRKDEIPNWVNFIYFKNPTNKISFDAVDTWLSNKLKNLWEEFKVGQQTKIQVGGNIKQNIQYYSRFAKESYEQKGGKTILNVKNKVDCSDLGLKYDNCAITIFQCLISTDDIFMHNCLKNLSNITSDLYDDDSIKLANPEIILILLNKLGFKAIKNEVGNIIINDVDNWYQKTLPTLYPDINQFNLIPENNLKNYLKKLVNFINSIDTQYLIDKEEHKTKKINDLDIDKVREDESKIPVEGLIKFYEFKRANNFMPPSTTKDLMTNLFLYHNLQLPEYLQNGGEIKPEDFRRNYDEGNTGYKYLKNIYDLLLKSLKTVTIDPKDLEEIDNLFKEFEILQEKLLLFVIFIMKLKEINDMFLKYPNKYTLKKEDIDKLQQKLDFVISDFKQKEDGIQQLIEAIARKEKNPNDKTSIFD